MDEATREFRAPRTITPTDLGDDLARLVWESFSDFVSEGETATAFDQLQLVDDEGNPDTRAVEESLIFLMWAHTRGVQQAFFGRAPSELLKQALDELHSAVFEDLVANGTPRTQLPLFEQRVGARYSEYHQAAENSDADLARAVLRHLAGGREAPDAVTAVVAERALAVAGPLRDYLEEVELIPA
ncbi:MAG: hypothetical protein D6701_01025 [Gemmatimonadetes bacterium]|nr:MAG: hypothetical protein D6701_01025 [Gemmatimonadota bacterium]